MNSAVMQTELTESGVCSFCKLEGDLHLCILLTNLLMLLQSCKQGRILDMICAACAPLNNACTSTNS